MFILYSSHFKVFIKGISKEWSSFVSVPLVHSSRGAWVFPCRSPLRFAQSYCIFLTHDSFIYLLWKVGRPAHSRLFQSTRLGLRIQKDRTALGNSQFLKALWTFQMCVLMAALKVGFANADVEWSVKFAAGHFEDKWKQNKGRSILVILPRIKLNIPTCFPAPSGEHHVMSSQMCTETKCNI